jgi:two-component system LytT family response regulator
MKITAVIIDDEPPAREHVRTLLAAEVDVEIVAECANGPEALALLGRRPVDLLLLDVQMPEMDGFALLRLLSPPLPLVIFVTAFDRHAMAAFDVHAIDYVLKPLAPDRFGRAIAHARTQLAAKESGQTSRRLLELLEAQPKPPEYPSRLMVRHRGRTQFIPLSDIDWIEAANNYAVVHVGTQNHLLRETLRDLEAQLPPRDFFRLSRSAMVRLDRVRQLEPVSDDEHIVILRDGSRLPLTRSVRELQERLRFG